MLAATDRVALDAVGVAILRLYKTMPEVSQGKIFEHPQIKRAVELGLGARGPQRLDDQLRHVQDLRSMLTQPGSAKIHTKCGPPSCSVEPLSR